MESAFTGLNLIGTSNVVFQKDDPHNFSSPDLEQLLHSHEE